MRTRKVWFIVARSFSLYGCAADIKLRHPSTGQIAICRGGYPTGWAGAFSMERQMRCLDDFQRQGYERLPE
jgi:hypothetical protein